MGQTRACTNGKVRKTLPRAVHPSINGGGLKTPEVDTRRFRGLAYGQQKMTGTMT